MSEPLFEPNHGHFGVFQRLSTQFVRTRNHHNRNSTMARRFDLGVGCASAGVLGYEYIDVLAREKCRFCLPVERAATEQQPDIWRQRDIARRIDGPREVGMMRPPRKGAKLEAAKREENTARRWPQRVGGGFGARDGKPVVAGLGLPGWAYDRGERDREPLAGGDRAGGDPVGVGVCRVNDRLRCVLFQPDDQALDAAKAADSRSNRLHFRVGGTPGKGDGRLEARVGRDEARQLRGLRGAAKDENAHKGPSS